VTIAPLLTFARLAIWEASRRKLLIAIALLTLVIIVATGWGFSRISDGSFNSGQPLSEVERRFIASQFLIMVAFMFSAVLALSAVLVASPSISGDLESNLALSLLARPVRRADYVLGKWLGLALLVVAYAVASGTLELLAVNWATGYVPPHPVQLIAFMAGEGLVLLTLAVLLSTRMAGMTGGLIALVMYFIGWLGGIIGGIGQGFDNAAMTNIGLATHLLVPTDSLWRGAVYAMEPAAVLATARAAGKLAAANPFAVSDPIQPAMVVWVVLWVVGMLALSLWSFRTRDV
jgi:ABC-type transport system involved in multi-copper enzyme maturation permease subunit